MEAGRMRRLFIRYATRTGLVSLVSVLLFVGIHNTFPSLNLISGLFMIYVLVGLSFWGITGSVIGLMYGVGIYRQRSRVIQGIDEKTAGIEGHCLTPGSCETICSIHRRCITKCKLLYKRVYA